MSEKRTLYPLRVPSVGILFVDESGNPHCPWGPETLAVAGVFVEGRGVTQLRRHAEHARRRAAEPVPELRYRLDDSRSKRFFFDEEHLRKLPVRVWAVTVRIEDMGVFRKKYDPRRLYEHLLYVLVSDAVCGLGHVPDKVHFDPCSHFFSQREFTRALETRFEGCRVAFAPDSAREKGLQAADMAEGAARRHNMGGDLHHWGALVGACGATCRVVPEREIRRALQ